MIGEIEHGAHGPLPPIDGGSQSKLVLRFASNLQILPILPCWAGVHGLTRRHTAGRHSWFHCPIGSGFVASDTPVRPIT